MIPAGLRAESLTGSEILACRYSGRGHDTCLEFVRRDDEDGMPHRGISRRTGNHERGIDGWVGGGHEFSLVEKLRRKSSTIFICAGTSAAATAAAVHELVRWRALADAYPDGDFARVFVLDPRRAASTPLMSTP